MNDIKIFENEKFGKIRTAGTMEEPLFCLADVCKALDLQSSAVTRRLEDGVISSRPIQDNLGRAQLANFVNEDGLYDVILDSRKPEAKAFRKWVTSEVLPSIRKTAIEMKVIATTLNLVNIGRNKLFEILRNNKILQSICHTNDMLIVGISEP